MMILRILLQDVLQEPSLAHLMALHDLEAWQCHKFGNAVHWAAFNHLVKLVERNPEKCRETCRVYITRYPHFFPCHYTSILSVVAKVILLHVSLLYLNLREQSTSLRLEVKLPTNCCYGLYLYFPPKPHEVIDGAFGGDWIQSA